MPIDTQELQEARDLIADARRVVAFTGAGISAESGVPTYRGAGARDMSFGPEVASRKAFLADPEKVWAWHNDKRMRLAEIEPNEGHRALAEFEKRLIERDGRFAIVTQNVDGLHQRAGSTTVYELHGSLTAMRCDTCSYYCTIGFDPLDQAVPICPQCGNNLRPDVVWFGEELPRNFWRRSKAAIDQADVVLSIGTSSVVYPAAGLVDLALTNETPVIEVNLEPTSFSRVVDIRLEGKAGEILPQLLG
jgi:NAD-dependent deacetylase